jgi:hypothetical protein
MKRLSHVEELAGLPVHLGGHVHAAVEVGAPPGRRSAARRRAPAAVLQHVPDPGAAALGQLGRGAQRLGGSAGRGGGLGRRGGRLGQAWAQQPVVQFGACCAPRTAARALEGSRLVRAVADAHARRAGVARQLQVVRGVADHQRALGRHAELGHQLLQHQRVRLAGGLVGGARGVEQAVQLRLRQRLVQAAAALAGGHGQQVVARLQRLQHGQRAGNSTSSCWRAK